MHDARRAASGERSGAVDATMSGSLGSGLAAPTAAGWKLGGGAGWTWAGRRTRSWLALRGTLVVSGAGVVQCVELRPGEIRGPGPGAVPREPTAKRAAKAGSKRSHL